MSEPAYISQVAKHQDLNELEGFCEVVVKKYGVTSYLEIGSKFGCSVFAISRVMPPASTFVVVDKPQGTKHWKAAHPSLGACMARLKDEGHDAHLVWGDSTDPKIIDTVGQWAPFDLVFIDANHTLPYVRSDWEHYGQMGRMVAFHDIHSSKPDIAVPQLWRHLRDAYSYIEIGKEGEQSNGIGVLFRE